MPALAYRPSYVPDGYELRSDVAGEDVTSFGEEPDQTAVVFTRGTELDALINPVMVSATTATARPLTGTEGDPGKPVEVGLAGVVAVYHDGAWAPSPDDQQPAEGPPTVHWDSTNLHSITLYWDGGTCGVQGARSHGVTFDELLKVAQSLPIAVGA